MAANTAASCGPYVTLGAAVLNVCPIAKINVAPGFSPESFSLAQNLACPRSGSTEPRG